ncbi:glutamyl-Q tRNA(Asp) synthetase [Sphingomonas sp. UYAg733]
MPGTIITRFAPSPTGPLHLGHAFSAIQSHDRARQECGTFLLRIEDIDGSRSRPEHIQGIFDDLAWLGLGWDGRVVHQSERLDGYAMALDRLREMGLLYPCFCTRADIAASLSAPHGAGGAVYPGTCRGLDASVRSARIAGEAHAWRIDMARAIATVGQGGDLVWQDELAGPVVADPLALGDVVLARKDAPASYHLAVAVDDAAQSVTHIVRGRDLFEATHVHRLLQEVLGLPVPIYRHHALLTDSIGNRLAKRDGAPTLASLRLDGVVGPVLLEQLRNGALPIGFGVASD